MMRKRPSIATFVALLATTLAIATTLTVAIAPAAQAATPVRIMPLGDSITGSPGCWRALLWNRLQTNGFIDIDMVGTLGPQGCSVPYDGDNEGHGGALVTTVADQNQLVGWLASARPDIVLMHFGTNDVWSNRTTDQILAAYGKLVDQMRASKATMKILVAKIIPVAPPSCPECPARTVALNNAIPSWAAGKTTAQSPITVVDQWTNWNPSSDTGDGVHPNAAGDQKMSNGWYPALASALGSTPPPVDTSAPSVPTTPVASQITNSSATLSWSASTDNVGVSGYDIYRAPGVSGGTFVSVGTATGTTFTSTGMSASSTYRFQVRARDAAGNVSAFSSPVLVVTGSSMPPADVSPPTVPGTPVASGVTATSANLAWTASTDNIVVTGYDIYRAPGASGGTFTSVGTSTTNSFAATGLTAATTYRYQVRARDGAGNLSAFSSALTLTTTTGATTTPPPSGGGCTATYRIANSWPGAFQGEVLVTNTRTTAISTWTVTLTTSSGMTITQMWGGTYSPATGTVTVRPTYNASLGAGQSTTAGFIANANGSAGATASVTCSA